MKFMRYLFFMMVFLAASQHSIAGIKWVDVGVNGLTCSMCTRSVEMSLRKLDFVDSVVMSLETTEGRIFLEQNVPVNFEQIAKAVVNAGFSVRFMKLGLSFEDVSVGINGLFELRGQSFQWIRFNKERNQGTIVLKLIDEGFLPKKEAVKFKEVIEIKNSNQTAKPLHVIKED